MYYFLVACPSDHSFLVKSNNELPTIPYNGPVTHFLKEVVDQVQTVIKHDLHLNFLRAECFCSEASCQTLLVFEALGNEKLDAPKNWKWVAQSAANRIVLVPTSETVQKYLDNYVEDGLEANGNRLYPFSRAGWFESACHWIKTNLDDCGEEIESIEKLQRGLGSCVLMAKVKSGALFYMKCSIPLGWWDEVRVTCALAEVMPEQFKKPLAVILDRGWMLMRDYGKALPLEYFETNVDMAKRVTCYWAEIQKKSVSHVQELVDQGVPKVDGEALKAAVERVMENPVWFKAQRDRMKPEQLELYSDEEEYKEEYRQFLKRLFDKIEGYNVPLAIVHGDVESVNAILGEDKCTFIDMFYTQVSFPFLDVMLLPAICQHEFHEFDLDFYLEYWKEYESMDRLRELLLLVDEVQSVESTVTNVDIFEQAEEAHREPSYMELKFPVCRTFNLYKD